MRKIKAIFLSVIIILNSIMLTGCWNYRELDKLAIVVGVAIDKDDKNDGIVMTVEIVEFTNEKVSKTYPKVITLKGKTVFDAARNGISVLGKKLYWSHLKVVIISEEVARDGVIKVLDWVNRDSETRADVNILVSRGNSAKEILQKEESNEIKSLRMSEMLDNQKNLSKAPHIEIADFINSLASKGMVPIVPMVKLNLVDGIRVPQILGTGIFKEDKIIGFLDEEETKDLLFVQDKVKGGVLVHIEERNNKDIPITLEIFKSKTKIKPEAQNSDIKFYVDINTTTIIDELGGTVNFIEEDNKNKLEKSVAETRIKRIKKLIKKIQEEYGVDIFGFGVKLKEDKPKVWKSIEDDWENKFKYIKVEVSMDVKIRNSSMLSKPLEIGE